MAGFGGGYPTSQARAKKNVRLTRPFVSTPMFTATEGPITILTLVFFLGDRGRFFGGGGGGRGAGRLGAGGGVGLRHGGRAVQWWLPVAERNWVLVLQPGASLLLRIEMVQRNRVRRVHAVRESRQGEIGDKSERVESRGKVLFWYELVVGWAQGISLQMQDLGTRIRWPAASSGSRGGLRRALDWSKPSSQTANGERQQILVQRWIATKD